MCPSDLKLINASTIGKNTTKKFRCVLCTKRA